MTIEDEPERPARTVIGVTDSVAATPSSPQETLTRLASNAPRGDRFENEKEVARGGMGAILRTWDPELRRELARKVLLGSSGPEEAPRPASEADDRTVSRFIDEAHITGQLDHPGIVPVHELGIDAEGRLYFTMRLVRGQDLERVFKALQAGDPAWSRASILQMLLKVCEAMAYAHSKRIVHRDLKPANIMVGRFGEVYVMDWGLARVLDQVDRHDIRLRNDPAPPKSVIMTDRARVRHADDSSPLITMDGDVLGTPAYMAPEQAHGQLHLVDRRADVYSLGAMLYHVLTGHAPYMGADGKKDILGVWKAVKSRPPTPLSSAAPKAPPELVAICEKAMARDLLQRYADMRELEQDLRAFLENRVVRAYEAGAWAQFRKWVVRNKAMASVSAAAIALAIGGLATISYIEARGNNDLQEKNALLAETSEALALARDGALASERVALLERDASERLVRWITGLFRSSAPENARGEDLRVREVLDSGVRELVLLEDEPLLTARMREAMGSSYFGLGLFDEAEPLLEQALADRRRLLEPGNVDTATSLDDLGFLRYHQQRYDEAQALLEEALRLRVALLGESSGDVQKTRRRLALVASKDGRLDEARELLEVALAHQEGGAEIDDKELLRTQDALGGVLLRLDLFEAARPLLEQAYEGRLAILGEDHPDTLISQNNLAYLLTRVNELAEARELLELCLERQVKVNGESHPYTLGVKLNLGALLLAVGEAGYARELLSEALEASREALGPTHTRTFEILNTLAAVEFDQENFEAAADHFEEALSGLRAKLAADHPYIRTVRESLVDTYGWLGQPSDALRHARDIVYGLSADDPALPALQARVERLTLEAAEGD